MRPLSSVLMDRGWIFTVSILTMLGGVCSSSRALSLHALRDSTMANSGSRARRRRGLELNMRIFHK
ncbi:hypothetical protein D3C86_2129140 [compost metagenome]